MEPLKELLRPGETVLALVGAGGKTTLARTLARQLSGWGSKTLVTTTTRILPPSRNLLLLSCSERVPPYACLTVGHGLEEGTGKLVGLTPEEIPALKERFRADVVLVEADGAAGRPIKAPAGHEPVIPECADVVIGVVGLDCLGRPLGPDWAHRPEVLARVTGMEEGEVMGLETLKLLARHPLGLFKGSPPGARKLLFVNKLEMMEPPEGLAALEEALRGLEMERVAGSAKLGWFKRLD